MELESDKLFLTLVETKILYMITKLLQNVSFKFNTLYIMYYTFFLNCLKKSNAKLFQINNERNFMSIQRFDLLLNAMI